MAVYNSIYEDNLQEVFKLRVVEGQFAGDYDIIKPSGFDEIDCVLDIDDETFNVNSFVLGDTSKINFMQSVDPKTFILVNNVFEEQGGDGQILFLWSVVKGDEIVDILGVNYSLNLNQFKTGYKKSKMFIETEIKKRESQNKLLTREDVTVNLFNDKDLDENNIVPAETVDIFFKEPARRFTNFNFFTYGQSLFNIHHRGFWRFTKGDDFEFGDGENRDSGYSQLFLLKPSYKGPLLYTQSYLDNLKVELSNFHIVSDFPFKLVANAWQGNADIYNDDDLVDLVEAERNEVTGGYEVKIVNEVFDIGSKEANTSVLLRVWFNDEQNHVALMVDEQASIELHTDRIIPIRRTPVVMLKDAVNQVCKQLTSSEITVDSDFISNGGWYENTAVSTGLFLRGVSNLYLGNERLNTSLKTILYDSTLRLLAAGFDIQDNRLVIEGIDFFFKDIETHDFSDKQYVTTDLEIKNDAESTYNTLEFGSKKYSTNTKDDIQNFNTKLEATTPIKSLKRKFDKTVECIIDDVKIQDLILDTSSKTNDSDDDIVFIDLVKLENYVDNGILTNCVHRISNGALELVCVDTPFDTLAVSVGDNLTILSGLNVGSWLITAIDKSKVLLNKTSGIEEGTTDTIVMFTLQNITKNRLNEGFSDITNIKGGSASNMRHNPKYQLARWFPYYGSNLSKKTQSESIIVTNYKNNGNVTMKANAQDLDNELQGLITLDANETLGRLRGYKNMFFDGKSIKITLDNVSFSEFFSCYNKWRYGFEGDKRSSRGYITVKVNGELLHLYLFGGNAMKYDRKNNHLTLEGKIKNKEYNEGRFKIFDYTFDYTFE